MIIEIAHEDIERASAMMADLCAPMTDMVLQDAVAYFAAHRQAAYAAGVAAERGKSAAMLEALRAAELALPVLRDMLARLKLSGGIKAADDTLAQIRAAIAAATEGGA